jgi:DnaK suppressor protein
LPTSEPQNDFSAVKTLLEQKLSELTDRASEIDDDLSETPDADWDENAIDAEQDEVLERVGQATNEEIAQIKRALIQIDAGSYGTCTNCGTVIDAERLEALPFSTRCVKCS